jgi:hypothetical protein
VTSSSSTLKGGASTTTAGVTPRIYPGSHFFFLESVLQVLADFAEELEHDR